MGEIITFEEAYRIKPVWNNIDIKTHPLFIAAKDDPSCSIYKNTNTSPVNLNIIAADNNIAENVIGFMICLFTKEIGVYLAKKYGNGITSDAHVCDFKLETPLSEIIHVSRIKINTCPICGKSIPYREQKGYSFAGRCCPACLPEMQKQCEYPGWYN